MLRHGSTRLILTAAATVYACWASTSAAPLVPSDIEALMTRVGERVADYYRRAYSVICLENSTVQPIQWNWSPEGFARTVESELHVESETADGNALTEPKVMRNVLRINGRPPRERDKKDRAGCTDPTTLSPEPLAFLLPAGRGDYRFTSVRDAREGDRPAFTVDFMTANRTSRPELVEDERGHDDCFDWSGPVATRGRLWIDANTSDVLRIDRYINGPLDVRVPLKLQRRYRLPPWIVVDRDDQTLRYEPVAFSDPDEVIVLPKSIESLTVVRTGLQSVRRTETFTNYRRFLTKGRMVRER